MDVRDAVEDDAERMAELTDAPTDVMRNLVHDRTVRIAETDADGDPGIVGFVSFDAQDRTVYVTQLEGPAETCLELLNEPIRFAEGEGMNVEILIAESDDERRTVAEDAGFSEAGTGPRFGDTLTIRYRR